MPLDLASTPRSHASLLLLLLAMLPAVARVSSAEPDADPDGRRIALRLDASASEAVLAMLQAQASGESNDRAWNALQLSTPYRRLHEREAAMGRAFTDDDFRDFVLSRELAPRADALRRTLVAWTSRDLESSATRILAYLPPEASIRATVFPMIKPRMNSFVFDLQGDPAIFLALDPDLSAEQFENIVLHELHHIGLASLDRPAAPDAEPTPVDVLTRWTGAFGEGLAMLAAAGGVDIHPHATSPADDRARWDRDMKRVDQDLVELDLFFQQILDGTLDDEQILDRARTYYGVQGPWYTVGYHMAATVERRFGRGVLIDCMRSTPRLLLRYDEAVRESPDHGATWSRRVLEALRDAESSL